MSYFKAEVINLPPLEKHPNADSLSLVRLTEPLVATIVVNTEAWTNVEKAVYVPVDSVLPDKPEYEFLGKEKRIKGIKLRGIVSLGMLLPAKPEWEVGRDVTKELGIVKYDDTLDNPKKNKDLQIARAPSGEVKYTDIESLRKYWYVFNENENLICHEKLHGANSRYLFQDNQIFCGSHRQWLKEGNNFWWNAFFSSGLPEVLPKYPNKIFFGEVFGQVQDMKYNTKKGEIKLSFFDIFDIAEGRFLDNSEVYDIIISSGLDMVPHLYTGPWLGLDHIKQFSEGVSAFGEPYKEGFVIKPLVERFNENIGRVILKYHSDEFLSRKRK